MGLAARDVVRSLLASPCCQAPLQGETGALACTQCGRGFGEAGGMPVLVDFSNSILDEQQVLGSAARSPIRRRRNPWFRRFLQPSNEHSARNVASMLQRLPERPRVLVVGGGTIGEGTKDFYASEAEIVAFDIYASDAVHVVADAHRIPFATASFDAALIQAVLEHVLLPEQVVGEIWRVLRPEGLVYAETPFLQPVHEGPYDFTRFTESGHRWLFRRFERLDSGVVGGPATQFLWSWNYLVRSLFRSRAAGLLARTLLVPLWLLDRTVPRSYAIDAAAGVFFLGQRAEHEVVSPRDMVGYYGGAQA